MDHGMMNASDDSAKLAVLEEIRALMEKLDESEFSKAIPKLAAKAEEPEGDEGAKPEVKSDADGDEKGADPDVAKLKAIAK
jgi:hypothetical protein